MSIDKSVMNAPANPMEIFKALPGSNCGECKESACMAFAVKVFKNDADPSQCPHIGHEMARRFAEKRDDIGSVEEGFQKALEKSKRTLSTLDLSKAAQRVNAPYSMGRLTLKMLGKDVSVDSNGNLSSDIHLHGWVTLPFLDYIINGSGKAPSGNWAPFRELKHGRDYAPLFKRRCEAPMKKIADTRPPLFNDLIHIFNGKQAENHYQSDIALVTHPLPAIPMLICHWAPDEGLESDLKIFFDSNAQENIGIGSLYQMAAGMALMFEKLAQRHGF